MSINYYKYWWWNIVGTSIGCLKILEVWVTVNISVNKITLTSIVLIWESMTRTINVA